MKMIRGMDNQEVIERGVDALYKELGPAEARRFIALTHPQHRGDSVLKHRKWQASINTDQFIKEMRTAYTHAQKRKPE
jgi:hypothetical protein